MPEPRRLARLTVARHAAAARSELSRECLRQPAAQFEFAAQGPGLRPAAIAWCPLAVGAAALELACPFATGLAGSAQPVAWAQQAPSLRPVVPALRAAPCGPVAPRSGEPAERYARAVRPRVAAVHAGAVQRAAPDAQGVRPPEAVAASDAAAVPRQAGAAVRDAEEQPQAGLDARAAARPSAAPWVFRRGLILPWFPAPQRAARSAHAMRRLRAASRSVLTWQAARCGVLS